MSINDSVCKIGNNGPSSLGHATLVTIKFVRNNDIFSGYYELNTYNNR